MFEERDTRLDILALGLLVIAVVLALSLFTYNPADPPVELVYPLNQLYHQDLLTYPLNQTTTNACGPWGSLVAAIMLDALGIGAYYAVLSLGVLTTLLLLRREIDSPVIRTIGWVLSLVGVSALAAMLAPQWTPGPVLGSGGYLGALVATILKLHFAAVGGFLLATSMLVGGLLLCTDYVLVHVGLFLGTLTLATIMGIRGYTSDDEEEDDEEEEDEDVVAVRVRGKAMHAVDADEEGDEEDNDEDDGELGDEEDEYEEDEYEEEEDADEDEEEAEPAPAKIPAAVAAASMVARRGRRRLAALRVRRPPEPEDREEVMNQLDAASQREDVADYELPGKSLLLESADFCYEQQAKEVRRKAKILEKTFESFGFEVKVVEIETGPVIAQYEVELESGLRLSKITGLADDLAIALRVPSVRIVAPIPGKNTVGIEVPNEERQLVRLREVMNESNGKVKKMRIPLFLGKDVSGNAMTVDLSTLPHLLIAGRTGTGKSVCLNAIITSILMTRRPDEVRMLMIDPKMVELSGYKSLPHLMHPVVTDMRKAEAILAWAVEKMEERYTLLAQAGVRHLAGYNQLGREELLSRIQPESDDIAKAIPTHMPYIVIVADEIADMMMTAGKEVEQHIIRLAQKSRAVGIHLILATQKPTVDVITGLIKSNLPARISFQVASRTDSRVVLDEMGADKLLGNGDMLFLWPGTSTLLRGQGTFVADDEINAVVDSASTGEQHFVKELVHLKIEDNTSAHTPESLKKRDELYQKAIEVVVQEGRGSVSLLQRALGIGYGRAARLIDFMAEDGIVGPYAGSQAREVLMTMADVERLDQSDEPAPLAPVAAVALAKPKRKLNQVIASQTQSDDVPLAEDEDDDEFDAEIEDAAADVEDEVEDELQDDEEEVDEADEDQLEDDELDGDLDGDVDYVYEEDDEQDASDDDDEEEGDDEEEDDEEDVEYEYVYEDVDDEYEDDPDAEYEYVEEEYDDADCEYEDDYEESA